MSYCFYCSVVVDQTYIVSWVASSLCLPQAVLVLCRGIFTPQNDVVESKWEHHVFAAVFQPESGGFPLASAFAEVNIFFFHV